MADDNIAKALEDGLDVDIYRSSVYGRDTDGLPIVGEKTVAVWARWKRSLDGSEAQVAEQTITVDEAEQLLASYPHKVHDMREA